MSKGRMVEVDRNLLEKVYALLNNRCVVEKCDPEISGRGSNVWVVKEEVKKVLDRGRDDN